MEILSDLKPIDLKEKIEILWDLSGQKILSIEDSYDPSQGAPVFTVKGQYTTMGWTEWTQGFQYGSAILQFDATGAEKFLESGRKNTLEKMAPHISHFGVHDHGFNNVSTYGNLLRLMKEGKIVTDAWEKNFYELALKISGAVQAARWTDTEDGGFIYSFNGAHSLFVDTIRTLRVLVLSHCLGHDLRGEQDVKQNLLERALTHAISTAKYAIYYGNGRDRYDVLGRTAHESIFNVQNGVYRCANAQQGYTGFSTWTRGLSWAMLGFAEQLEFLDAFDDGLPERYSDKKELLEILEKAATATCEFYIENTAKDGIPYWDTGAPNLHKLGDYLSRPAEPFNDFEPVDSSAAAIGAQGLLRLGKYLKQKGDNDRGQRFYQAGLTVAGRLMEAPYLSQDPEHQGLLLHANYHYPNDWDHVPEGSNIPHSESCMWGDYHLRELALYLQRMIENRPYYSFYASVI
ncbi:glycoside hydrolase family 88 protein [Fulvivirgaceae bacterium BMA12]|uniref:Glycoside hydrolase family 88 protein n=1 Tax=Agaribacillus aureus TaxID=3051825 RepID=A0ABT8L210_9BACT|nr:glycoside hydrolase family 88 protein [Fulvivirgaceae bacterium BMA12]